MRLLKCQLVAIALLLPEIGRADILATMGRGLVHGSVMREMASFGRSDERLAAPQGSGPIALDGGYKITMAGMKTFFNPGRVIVAGHLNDKSGKALAIFEMELVDGAMTSFRTMVEYSAGWSHELSSSATGGNRGGSDSM